MTESKNRIEINDAYCITNGSPEQLESIQQPNAIGKVIQNDTNKELCEITPLIMVINQSSSNVQEKVNALVKAGAVPDLEIRYYNNVKTTPRKLARKYRKTIQF